MNKLITTLPEVLESLYNGLDMTHKMPKDEERERLLIVRVAIHFNHLGIVEAVNNLYTIHNSMGGELGKLNVHLIQYRDNVLKLKLKEHIETHYSAEAAQYIFSKYL